MTQAITKTLNNLEQILTSSKEVKRFNDAIEPKMDKSSKFERIFDSTIKKKDSTNDDNSAKLNQQPHSDQKDTLTDIKSNNDTSSINNDTESNHKIVNTLDSIKSNDETKVSITSEDFKKILANATEDANIESSLDLTLAKDISEIISQLKDAIENVSKIIETNSDSFESNTSITEDIEIAIDELTTEKNDNLETPVDTTENEDKTKEEVPFEQLVMMLSETNNNSLKNINNGELEIEDANTEQYNPTKLNSFDTSSEIIEFSENVIDEVAPVTKQEKTSDQSSNMPELNIDEEIIKDLKIETISAQTNTSSEDSLMQNQTPEEIAVKAMINTDTDTFEVKLEQNSETQTMEQTQTKSTETNPSRIIDQITKQMKGLQNNGKVNIVLNPESLGKVNIQLLNTKEGLTAQFTVTTQEARDLLTKGLDGLKESLGTQGIAVDNISVKVTDSQKSEQNQDWTEQEGSRGGNKQQGQNNKEEKEKGLFEKMMAQTTENKNGNV